MPEQQEQIEQIASDERWRIDPGRIARRHHREVAAEALAAAHRRGGADELARTAERHIWPLLTVWPDRLEAVLAAMPREVLERHPMLRGLHPVSRLTAAPPILTPGDAAPSPLTDDERAQMLTLRMMSVRRSGDTATAAELGARLRAALTRPRVPSLAEASGPIPFCFSQTALTDLLAGDTLASLRDATAARQIARLDPDSPLQRDALSRIAVAHALRGSLAEADAALAAGRDLPLGGRWFAGPTRSAEQAAAALIRVERAAVTRDDPMVAATEADPADELWPVAALARARASLSRGVPADAHEIISMAFEGRPVSPGGLADDIRMSVRIDAHVAARDLGAARAVAQSRPDAGPLSRLSLIRLRLHGGDAVGALADVRRESAAEGVAPGQRDELQLLGAWATVALAGALEPAHAAAIARLAENTSRRRLLVATLPCTVVEAIAARVDQVTAQRIRDAVDCGAPIAEESAPTLSSAELSVLQALAATSSVQDIAESLFVSRNTVKTHLRSIYAKLGVHARPHALAAASRWGLLVPSTGVAPDPV